MVKIALDSFGDVDILYNNAGAGIRKKVHEHTDDEWNFVLDTNLNAMFRGARAVLPHFIKKKSGNIVTTASTFGLLASPNYPGYCATKAAIINLTREMAMDYGPLGIRINCVCPGAIETPRFRGFPPRATLGEGMTDEQRKVMGDSNKALLRMKRKSISLFWSLIFGRSRRRLSTIVPRSLASACQLFSLIAVEDSAPDRHRQAQ